MITTVTVDVGGKPKALIRRHPPLLDQLHAGLQPSTAEDVNPTWESRPPCRTEILDAIIRIEQWAVTVGRALDLHGPPRRILADIPTAAHRLDDSGLQALASDLHTLHTLARILTTWDTPPARPNLQCTHCDRRGAIRVRIDTLTAICLNCHTTWGPHNIGLLAAANTPPATA